MKKGKAPGAKSAVVSTKHLPAAGSEPALSAKIGGVANANSPGMKKGK